MHTVIIKLNAEDCTKLERLNYLVEARLNLIQRLYMFSAQNAEFEPILTKHLQEYEDTFIEYEQTKAEVDMKYRPDKALSWSVLFPTQEIVYEVED